MSFWSRRNKRYTGGADPAATYLQDQQDAAEQAHEAEAYGIAQAARAAQEQELSDLQRDFENTPELLRTRYTSDAQRAGTFSNTGEFASGLDSEVEAGIPGARASNMARQQALQAELGLPVSAYDPSAAEPPPAAVPQAVPTGQTNALAPQTQMATDPESDDSLDPTTGQQKNARQKAIKSQLGGTL